MSRSPEVAEGRCSSGKELVVGLGIRNLFLHSDKVHKLKPCKHRVLQDRRSIAVVSTLHAGKTGVSPLSLEAGAWAVLRLPLFNASVS